MGMIYRKMEYFHVANFTLFCLKNMRINICGFWFSRSFIAAKIVIATVPTFYIYFRDNSKPVGIVSNNIAVTMFKQLHN